MNIKTLVSLAAILAVSPAWAVNKCSIDGQSVFQDAPCPGKGEALVIRPASGAARPSTPAPTDSDKKPMTEVQRIEANIASSQKERRLRDLSEREVPSVDHAIRSNRRACKEEQERLEMAKGQYVQNLYGKIDAAQRAAEQAAAASRCDTKDRELRDRYDRLVNECKQLGGCK